LDRPEHARRQGRPYAAIGKELIGHVDNSLYPPLNVDIEMILVTPAEAKGPVPVMMLFGRGLLPGASAPTGRGRGEPPPDVAGSDLPATQQLLAHGWGCAYLNPTSVLQRRWLDQGNHSAS